jgi:hypothetical protein
MDLLQSQVTPLLEMDTAQLSKIEKGLRQLKREQISIFAEILKDSQICAVLKDERMVNEAMLLAEEKSKQKNRCKSFIK